LIEKNRCDSAGNASPGAIDLKLFAKNVERAEAFFVCKTLIHKLQHGSGIRFRRKTDEAMNYC